MSVGEPSADGVANGAAGATLGPALGVLVGLSLALAALALFALTQGAAPLSLGETFRALFGFSGADEALAETVIWNIRVPRILAAILVGVALAGAGAAYQGLFRNPLVAPDILGVSTGAGLGAVLGIFLSLPVAGIQLLAFFGGLGTVSLVYVVAKSVGGRDPVLVLVLSGVVIGALAGALISLLKVLADPYDQLPAIVFWLLGSLAGIKAGDLMGAVPFALAGLVPLILLRWRMNVMALGDEEAHSLGVDARRLRLILIFCATLMTASVVAIAGVIGWVGLVIPHIARMLVGPNFVRLLPVTLLLGASFLLMVDTLARTLTPTEVPIGIVTALVGAPFFIFLLARGGRAWG